MTATIYQFIPRPNPNRLTPQELEAMACAILNEALDPMKQLLPEQYSAPGKDSA